MKEEQILERIKNLQDDIKYSFKQTSEVIDIIYRQGVNDEMTLGGKDSPTPLKKESENPDVVVMSSKELNEAFGTKPNLNEYINTNKKPKKIFGSKKEADNESDLIEQRIQRTKRDCYLDMLKYIESKNDLMDVYIYIKEKCKEYGEPGVRNKFNNRERKRENPWM